jgi:uncharacterized membrane protein
MPMTLAELLVLVAALASALIAGVFWGFSTFIMRALGSLSPKNGIAAMQAINVTVFTPWFMGLFFGTPLLCIVIAALAWWRGEPAESLNLYLGCGLHVIGCFAVTAAGNVPLNERLAAVACDSEEAARLWRHYQRRWSLFNHLRTAASLAAAVLLLLALKA